MVRMSVKIDSSRLKKALNEAGKVSNDLSAPFRKIYIQWLKSNRGIFKNNGPISGKDFKWEDYAPSTYISKSIRKRGSPYPMLVESGALRDSITQLGGKGSYFSISSDKRGFLMGSTVVSKKGAPYPFFIQEGTSKMVARPFMLIGGSSASGANIQGQNRNEQLEIWIGYLEEHIKKKLGSVYK